eukprot:TRINITY_DN7207_c0_g1_i2.p1 TRINITY_DN7207_c0_g1~~TRINITY_DN7207_c0_g1_i2.p1  ORF type:complete len:607 (+),score=147.22 TRINITY_DN7207_c0_g1_i2:293-2113(+)
MSISGVEALLQDCRRVTVLCKDHLDVIQKYKKLPVHSPDGLKDALLDALESMQKCDEQLQLYHKQLLDNKLTVIVSNKVGAWIDEKEEQARIESFGPSSEAKSEFDHMSHYRREIHGISGLNLRAIGVVLWFLEQRFRSYLSILTISEKVTDAERRWGRKKWRDRDVSLLVVENNKIFFLHRFLPEAAAVPIDDYLISRHKRMEIEELHHASSPSLSLKLTRQLNDFFATLAVANGFCEHGWKEKSSFMTALKMGIGAVFYGLRVKKAEERFNFLGTGRKNESLFEGKNLSDDSSKFVKFLWDLPESGFVSKLYNLSFPNIARHDFFTIPGPLPVPVRFLSSSAINSNRSRLVIHFHGGGFVCQTSFSHQNYTRQWALDPQLDSPVLSVDYRLAPDTRYPGAPDDCFAVYRWVVENEDQVRQRLGYYPKTILLAGDSAGGNLAAAVCIKAIQQEMRKPDGLLLAYPALSISLKFTPSSLLCQVDRLVPTGFLLVCALSYVPDPANQGLSESDPVLCPVVADENILVQFPPTRFQVGCQDPLLDASVRLASKLHQLNRDVKLKLYEELGHGFLSFDSALIGIDEAHTTVLHSKDLLSELFLTATAQP